MNKPFLCPCCDKRFTQWMARYNHLQLVHRWENPPLGHKRWVDRKCTKNPSNDEIQRILDECTYRVRGKIIPRQQIRDEMDRYEL